MAQTGPAAWADFGDLHDFVKAPRNNTIDKLKRIIDGINDECRAIRPISKSGKKQDLIDRLCHEMSDWHAKQQTETWLRAKEVIVQVRDTSRFEPKRGPPAPAPAPTYTHVIAPGPAANYPLKGGHAQPALPNASAYQYNPAVRAGQPSAQASSSTAKPGLRFSPSPFFRVDQLVSGVVECMESISAMDRRSQVVSFSLNADQVQKLALKPPRYQLRLFCTSSAFYSPSRTNQGTCPVEFPPTCEVRVNGNLLNANLKGLKKKPGTAPPADLGSGVRVGVGSQNKVEMIYVNSQQPVQHKKFYIVVQLVETFSVDSVIEKMRKGKYRSKEEIMGRMIQTANEDDDIVAGPQKMSLKCPLSYVRISIPSRSVKCVHPQCFDATSWFSMMEQTTTWLCPVCEKQLSVEDVIVDGYFDSILKATDEDVEDVMVEADGEWHTTDNKYASDGWRTKYGPKTNGAAKPAQPVAPKHVPAKRAPSPRAGSHRTSSVEEIVILDSDDDDDDAGSSQAWTTQSFTARSSASASAAPRQAARASVIDLTLDSDDEEEPEPPRRAPPPPPPIIPVMKRKERERTPPENGTVKRARFDPPPPPVPATRPTPLANMIAASASSSSRTMNGNGASGSRTSTPQTASRTSTPLVSTSASVSVSPTSSSRIERLQQMRDNTAVYAGYQPYYMQQYNGMPAAPPAPAASPLTYVHPPPPAPPAAPAPARRASTSGSGSTRPSW